MRRRCTGCTGRAMCVFSSRTNSFTLQLQLVACTRFFFLQHAVLASVCLSVRAASNPTCSFMFCLSVCPLSVHTYGHQRILLVVLTLPFWPVFFHLNGLCGNDSAATFSLTIFIHRT